MTAKYYKFLNKRMLVLFDDEKNPWFKAKDVAICLGYGNPTQAIRTHVDDSEVLPVQSFTDAKKQGIGPIAKNTLFLNESALCSLILHSSKPEARKLVKSLLPDKFYLPFTNLED